jgi:hypothetical protein
MIEAGGTPVFYLLLSYKTAKQVARSAKHSVGSAKHLTITAKHPVESASQCQKGEYHI